MPQPGPLRHRKTGQLETAVVRRVKVLHLRKAGATIAEIASALGIPKSTAHRDVQIALAELAKEQHDCAESLRALELARLDAMLRAIAPQLAAGHLGAIDRGIKLSVERRTLLGLDMPAKLALTDPSGEHQYDGLSDHELLAQAAAAVRVAETIVAESGTAQPAAGADSLDLSP